jgi:hypothetical protein
MAAGVNVTEAKVSCHGVTDIAQILGHSFACTQVNIVRYRFLYVLGTVGKKVRRIPHATEGSVLSQLRNACVQRENNIRPKIDDIGRGLTDLGRIIDIGSSY